MNGVAGTASTRRLSRETRNLLIAALAALITLWVLARIRFPDAPQTPSPIPPLLTQLSARPAFAELEAELARLRTRLSPALSVWPRRTARTGASGGEPRRVALRFAETASVALLSPGPPVGLDDAVALDEASGLIVVRSPAADRAFTPAPWAGDQAFTSRYAVAAVPSEEDIVLQPLFISALHPLSHPAWSGDVWRLVAPAAPPEGALLFTHDEQLLGAVTRDEDQLLVIPGDVLLRDAQRLQARGPAAAIDLGIEVQSLTPSLAAATRSMGGVVVAHPGPHDVLQTGDVVEAMGGTPIRSVRDWRVRVARLNAAAPVMLDVVRGGERRTVTLSATPSPPVPARALGLTLQAVPRVGSEVIIVDANSAAALAGLRPGDVILTVGDIGAPSPAQVARAFANKDRPVLAGIRRGTAHRVVVLD